MPLDWRTPPAHIHYLERIEARVKLANRDGNEGLAGNMVFLSYFCREYREMSISPGFLPEAVHRLEVLMTDSGLEAVTAEILRTIEALRKKIAP